jgi:hypothetical protein
MKNGALNIKKEDSMLNTVTAEVTYLICRNTDVTSLLSGTAIKAVVANVSDYVSKPALKTYLIFEAIKSVYDRNSEMLGGSLKRLVFCLLRLFIILLLKWKLVAQWHPCIFSKIQIITQITNFTLFTGQVLYELLDMSGILTLQNMERTSWCYLK